MQIFLECVLVTCLFAQNLQSAAVILSMRLIAAHTILSPVTDHSSNERNSKKTVIFITDNDDDSKSRWKMRVAIVTRHSR